MATYWYIGPNQFRFIGSGDWANYGINSNDTSWSAVNGWGVDEALLSAPVKAFLDARTTEWTKAASDPLTRTVNSQGLDPERIYGLTKLIADSLYATKDQLAAAFLGVSVNLDNVYAKLVANRLSINGTQLTATQLGSDPAGAADTVKATLLDSVPTALNNLGKIGLAINNDPAFNTTITNSIAKSVRTDAAQTFNAGQQTTARTNIGALGSSEAAGLYRKFLVINRTNPTAGDTLVANQLRYISIAADGTFYLPAGSPAGTRVGIKRYDATSFALSVAVTGTDIWIDRVNRTTIVIRGQDTFVGFTSDGAGRWMTDANYLSLDYLDTRYLPAGGAGNYASYDGTGRLHSAEPAASTDVATKNYVDVTAGSSAPTGSKLIRRDSVGRAQVIAPILSADIANKGYVDSVSMAGGTSDPTPNSGMSRDGDARSAVAAPLLPTHIANKQYVDDKSILTFKRVYRVDNTPLVSNTITGMDLYNGWVTTIDDYKDNSFRVDSTPNDSVRVGRDGIYNIVVSVAVKLTGGTVASSFLRKNGVDVEGSFSSGSAIYDNIITTKLYAGDLITPMFVFVASGTYTNYNASTANSITFMRLGPIS